MEPYYLFKLKSEFDRRRGKNSRYSLRSYARSLGMDSSSLSAILKGKRSFPLSRLESLAKPLTLTPDEMRQFAESVVWARFGGIHSLAFESFEETLHLEEKKYFKVLAEWEYAAILVLMQTKEFEGTVKFISEKLELSQDRAGHVWNDLIELGLVIKNSEGKWLTRSKKFKTSEDVNAKALKVSHAEELRKSLMKLESLDVMERDFSSVMIAMPQKNMSKAKKLIRNFRRDFAELLETEDADAVYLLALQFYPLSK